MASVLEDFDVYRNLDEQLRERSQMCAVHIIHNL